MNITRAQDCGQQSPARGNEMWLTWSSPISVMINLSIFWIHWHWQWIKKQPPCSSFELSPPIFDEVKNFFRLSLRNRCKPRFLKVVNGTREWILRLIQVWINEGWCIFYLWWHVVCVALFYYVWLFHHVLALMIHFTPTISRFFPHFFGQSGRVPILSVPVPSWWGPLLSRYNRFS